VSPLNRNNALLNQLPQIEKQLWDADRIQKRLHTPGCSMPILRQGSVMWRPFGPAIPGCTLDRDWPHQ